MKLVKCTVLLLVAWAFVVSVTIPAMAQDEEGFLDAPWRFHVNLYGWLPEATASIKVNGIEVADVPEDLDTILDSMEAAAMFELEVHKGRVALFVNSIYYKGEYDQDFTGKVSRARRTYKLEEEVWAVKYGVGYRLGPWVLGKSDTDSPSLALYPWFGALYFSDDWETNVSPAGQFNGINKGGTLDFNTPMVGLTARMQFSERWYLNLSYGSGGWSVDNVDDTYDFVGNVGYRFTMWDTSSKVFAGYRYLHIKYVEQPVSLNVHIKGPFIGIGWEFDPVAFLREQDC